MDTEETPNTEAEGSEEVSVGISIPNSKANPYSRVGKDESVASWLESKAKRELERSAKRSAGRAGLKRGKINPVSKKQKKRNSGYKDAMAEHYSEEENQKCAMCGCRNALSIHHKNKRGKETDDAFYFITLCMIGDFMDKRYPDSNHSHSGGCHGWVEGNKDKARELKLLL